MTVTQLQIDAPARVKIDVNLVGKHYVLTPPKAALSLKIARQSALASKTADEDALGVIDVIDDWLATAFQKKDVADIQKRLLDPEDDLDYPQILELVKKVVEVTTGNPTS